MEINEQLAKKERIKMKPAEIFFEVFIADSTKNGEVIRIMLLKIKINRYKKQIDIEVMDLNSTDMFLRHDWLVKHNLEVYWKEETIQFIMLSEYYVQNKIDTDNKKSR